MSDDYAWHNLGIKPNKWYDIAMDIITQKLLAIESDAQQVMHALAKEEAQLQQKTMENLAQKMAEIEAHSIDAIEKMKCDAETEREIRADKIRADFAEKTQAYEALFNENKQIWREKIFNDVLFGEY